MLNQLHMAMISLNAGLPDQSQHFCKVHSYAKLIAELEGVDAETLYILEAAALTHDIACRYCREKYGNAAGNLQELEGPAIAEKMLSEIGFAPEVKERVEYLIGHHHTYDNIDGIDYQILVEADFIVNIHEGNLAKERIENILQTIFRTKTGMQIVKEMFGV